MAEKITASTSRPPEARELNPFPRHMAALNALAEKHGLSVEVVIEPYPHDGELNSIFAKWAGTKEQLFALGLFTPTQQRLPINRALIVVPSTINWHHHPLLRGYVTVSGSAVVYEVHFGEVPRRVIMRGDLEVAEYEDEASYHGTAEALIHQGVCDASQLPLGRVRWNRDCPHSIDYEGPRWYSRRQPDGTFLHWLENEAARQRRVADFNKRMEEYRDGVRIDANAPQSAITADRPRATHLRLVVNNVQTQGPQS